LCARINACVNTRHQAQGLFSCVLCIIACVNARHRAFILHPDELVQAAYATPLTVSRVCTAYANLRSLPLAPASRGYFFDEPRHCCVGCFRGRRRQRCRVFARNGHSAPSGDGTVRAPWFCRRVTTRFMPLQRSVERKFCESCGPWMWPSIVAKIHP
jgi:hypothetical protein